MSARWDAGGSSDRGAPSRILVITAQELTSDPRARRAAETAARHGLEVQGLCVSEEPGLPGISVRRVRGMPLEDRIRNTGFTRVGRSSRILRELRGLYRLWRHGLTTFRLVRAARGLAECGIVHANDFDTLPAAALIARRWRARLVYDSHELYTLQEPNPPRIYNAVVIRIEGALARRSDEVITVNPAFSAEIMRMLRLRRPPILVLNCPPIVREIDSRPRADGPLRVIYQAAMGPGRRVEDIVEAAEHADGAHITIRVVGADTDALARSIAARGVGDRVEIVSPAPPDKLVESLVGFDAGLIINRPLTRNDELVLPNKLFEYMMAGLAVVVPALPVVGELVERERLGVTFEPGNPPAMGRAIGALARDPALLLDGATRGRKLALETYNAEGQTDELARAWGIDPGLDP